MSKSVSALALACAMACGSSVAAEGQSGNSGVKLGFGFDTGFSLLLQFNNINLAVGDDGMALDYLFKSGSFGGNVPFTWYVGVGGWLDWDDWDHNASDDFGARLPLGLDWNFASNWDAYGQIHPELNYDTWSDDIDLDLGLAIGVRYAF